MKRLLLLLLIVGCHARKEPVVSTPQPGSITHSTQIVYWIPCVSSDGSITYQMVDGYCEYWGGIPLDQAYARQQAEIRRLKAENEGHSTGLYFARPSLCTPKNTVTVSNSVFSGSQYPHEIEAEDGPLLSFDRRVRCVEFRDVIIVPNHFWVAHK
jgi:hypothetical protein